jgi:hypothetical protein
VEITTRGHLLFILVLCTVTIVQPRIRGARHVGQIGQEKGAILMSYGKICNHDGESQ